MASALRFCLVLFLAVIAATLSKSIGETETEPLLNGIDQLADEDGSMELALIDYLLAKQIAQRLHQQLDVSDLHRKRSYWKQCAFNAVSCFGK